MSGDLNRRVSCGGLESTFAEVYQAQAAAMANGPANNPPHKEWSQYYEFGRQLSMDAGSSFFIPPENTSVNDYFDYADHPEAEDDEDDDDDDMAFDLPSTAFNTPGVNMCGPEMYGDEQMPPYQDYNQFAPPVYPVRQLEDYMYDDDPAIFTQQPSMPGFSDYMAPVDSIDPTDLQLSLDFLPEEEEKLQFETSSPVLEERMDVNDRTPRSSVASIPSISSQSSHSAQSSDWTPYSSPESSATQEEVASSRTSVASDDYEPTYARRSHIEKEVTPVEPKAAPSSSTSSSSHSRRKKMVHGPHLCEMVLGNGELCNKAFTRPYDLSRHQETIHAAVRKTYRCDHCGESSKTFSRMDALSRHIRIKHSK